MSIKYLPHVYEIAIETEKDIRFRSCRIERRNGELCAVFMAVPWGLVGPNMNSVPTEKLEECVMTPAGLVNRLTIAKYEGLYASLTEKALEDIDKMHRKEHREAKKAAALSPPRP